ncbi:hypothetical protein PoMZ_01569, partial [Pyricularia oryzae]
MPSSGSMISLKLRMSSGSGNSVFIVVPRYFPNIPFWTRSCAAVTFFFL